MQSGRKSNKPAPTPSPNSNGKKLVQAKLSFGPLTPLRKDSTEQSTSRKRKLSTSADNENPLAKINRLSSISTEIAKDSIEISDDESGKQETKANEVEAISSKSDSKTPKHKTGKAPSSNGKSKVKSSKKDKSKGKQLVWDESELEDIKEDENKIMIKLPMSSKKRKLNKKDICEKVVKNADEMADNRKVDQEREVTDEIVEKVDQLVEPADELAEKAQQVAEKTDLINVILDRGENDCNREEVKENKKFTNEDDLKEIDGNEKCEEKELEKNTADETELTVKTDSERKNQKKKIEEIRNVIEKIDTETDPISLNSSSNDDDSVPSKSDEMDKPTSTDNTEPLKTPQRVTVTSTENVKKLTPKQLQRQRAKEEREQKLREEKERKLQQRQKEKEEKEEQKRKEKDEKEEIRRKEKEERERKRQQEIDVKNEEKRVKDEEKRKKEEQKDEERRKKEEEKLAAEEAKNAKARKTAEAFTKFFVQKSASKKQPDITSEEEENQQNLNFMPFRIKEDMKLAPTVRRTLSADRRKSLENLLKNKKDNCPSANGLYLTELRQGIRVPEKDGRTLPEEDDEDDLKIIDDFDGAAVAIEENAKELYRAKFFKFEENRRPAYYGTWRKVSKVIKPRRPFTTDTKFFDYEIDSDDEWEEEEPGESLHGSDDEKESDDDYDIDNEFFVPHGHLSDEEKEDEADEDNSPAAQKEKLKLIQKEFAEEMKKKTEKIKPRLIGLIWQNKDGSQPSGCPNVVWDMLIARAMLCHDPFVSLTKPTVAAENDAVDSGAEDSKDHKSTTKKRTKIPKDVCGDLIRLIHGNTHNKPFLACEFRAHLAKKNEGSSNAIDFSKFSICLKIQQLAKYGPCPEDGPFLNKMCWYVSEETRKEYGIIDVSIPNNWSYHLKPVSIDGKEKERKSSLVVDQSEENLLKPIKSGKVKSIPTGGIEKFATILSEEEKKKKFNSVSLLTGTESKSVSNKNKINSPNTTTSATPNTSQNNSQSSAAISSKSNNKKRVKLLMSVPRGEAIPTKAKDALISQFLSDNSQRKNVEQRKDERMDVDVDEKLESAVNDDQKDDVICIN